MFRLSLRTLRLLVTAAKDDDDGVCVELMRPSFYH